MAVFYSTLVSTFLFSIFSRMTESKNKKVGAFFALFVVVTIVLVTGLRANIGDTGTYMNFYKNLANFNGFTEDSKDKGFIVFQLILYNFSSDPQFMVFVTSLITQICILCGLYKYKSYFELEVYMYITSGMFLTVMNGIRQAMVGAILFFCTKLIIDNKFITYAIIVLILSTIHGSALIMIPVYFIVRQDSWSKNTLIIIIITSIGFMFFYQLMPIFFSVLGDSSYTEYADSMMQSDIGCSFTRVLVNSVPVILSYIYRNKLKETWSESNIFINISLINLIFMSFALYHWIFARVGIYFQFYNMVLLPYIIKNCFEDKKEKRIIYYLFIVCYFVFFYYEQVIGGVGLGYRSNFFSL